MSIGTASICAEKEANSHESYHSIKIYWSDMDTSFEEAQFLLSILKSVKQDIIEGKAFNVFWYYRNSRQLEMGWDIASLLDLRFTFRHIEREPQLRLNGS